MARFYEQFPDQVALVERMALRPREEQEALILQAAAYRSGAGLINTVYMGSMATASLRHELGGGGETLEALVKRATPEQLRHGMGACANVANYMLEHPMRVCRCCKQPMPAERD